MKLPDMTPPRRPVSGAIGNERARNIRALSDDVTEPTEGEVDDEPIGPDDVPAEKVFPQPAPGRVRIGPDILAPDDLKALAELAAEIKLKGSLSPRRVDTMLKEIRTEQSISKTDLSALDGFARNMRAWHKELHGRYRDSDYTDKKVDGHLTKVHQFLHQWDGAKERYRIQARTEQLTRIAGESPSFVPTTAAFYTFAQVSQRDMKQALAIMDHIDDDKKGVVFGGNNVTTLTRDAIWQTKMRLLEEAAAEAKGGSPPEIDIQYYELTSQAVLSRLAAAARAGCKVRVNLDPGRLVPNRADGTINASEVAKKMLTAYRLLDTAAKGADIGLTFFPVEREIGETNLMHQKLFRVGDAVILGGMNGNSHSGENVDAAVLIEGPGARRLVGVFERDTNLSSAARLNDIYNPEHRALIAAGGMTIGPAALVALLMGAAGQKARSIDGPRLPYDLATLEALAEKTGTRLDQIIDLADDAGKADPKKLEKFLAGGDAPSNVLPLKRAGGRMLARQVREVVDRLNKPDNVARANDITAPSGEIRGSDKITVGDSPNERVAILLQAIATAESFIYVPSFVMTRVVARAICARYEEMKAQGKQLDVRVVLDPGIYPDGGTPNEDGYLALEDAGIPVRWARLTRTDERHDRKVHAKAVITEKSAFLGSTNMSSKGLKSNWELSGLVTFDAHDADSKAQHEALINDFLEVWEHESIRIDTRAVSESRLRGKELADHEARIEESRHSVVRASIHALNRYERESAKAVADLVAQRPDVRDEIERKVGEGMTRGYAMLRTLEETLGYEALAETFSKMGSSKALEALANGDYPFER